MSASDAVRLLPWQTPGGNPCFLLTDGSGYLSRVADNIERVQLDMADDLLGHAADMLNVPEATASELRFLAARLTEALRDVRRVAESRGARLPASDDHPAAIAPDDGHGGSRDEPELDAGAVGWAAAGAYVPATGPPSGP